MEKNDDCKEGENGAANGNPPLQNANGVDPPNEIIQQALDGPVVISDYNVPLCFAEIIADMKRTMEELGALLADDRLLTYKESKDSTSNEK